jgi:hypothetical protein
MRTFLALASLALLAVPASVFAANPQRQNPYANLFTGQLGDDVPQRKPSAPAVPPSRPSPSPNLVLPPTRQYPQPAQTVVCGLTVLQGDTTIDPKMPQRQQANAPKPSIRIFPAPSCRP